MDVSQARPQAARALKLAGLVAGAATVAVAVCTAAAFLWLRTYAPLDTDAGVFAPGPGVGAVIQPAVGSGGRRVFFPAYRRGRPFLASFTLQNHGRFGVEILGVDPLAADPPPSVDATGLLATDSVSSDAPVGHTHPFRPFALATGDTAVLVASFRLACPRTDGRVPSVFADTVRLRYRYLRWFERTQTVALPFAVTLRCVGGPLEKP